MPSESMNRDTRSRLLSVYLRPWVSHREHASGQTVPHLADLNRLQRRRLRDKQVVKRSYDQAWRQYTRGKVVSEHARQIIVNFMSACISAPRNDKGN